MMMPSLQRIEAFLNLELSTEIDVESSPPEYIFSNPYGLSDYDLLNRQQSKLIISLCGACFLDNFFVMYFYMKHGQFQIMMPSGKVLAKM